MPEKYDQYIKVTEKGTKQVVNEFDNILPELSGKQVLDVGCGTGILSEKYLKNNLVFGVDNNKKSLEIARKKGFKVKLSDLEKKLPFQNNEFDLVICKDVLEFIYNAEPLLNEMIRVTKKNGLLLIHVPNEFTILDLVNVFLGKGFLKKRWYSNSSELSNPHVRFFTKKQLVQHLEQKNIKIAGDYSSNWSFTLPVIKVKPRFLSKLSDRLFSPGITLLCRK